MKATSGIAFVLALAVSSFGGENPAPAMREVRVTTLLEKAETFYRAGKIDAARLECHRAFLIDPYDIRVHRMIVRVPLILKDSGGEIRDNRAYHVVPPNSAMEMQMIRFRAISTGNLPPALNPQLGK